MKRAFFASIICLSVYTVSAQSNMELANFKSQTNVFPPAPNAAALAKFVEIPVNTHTGIPQISVPLYSWKSRRGNASLGVSLSYHAGGIKAEDVASNSGLGWSLNAGGSISRSVRGLADDDTWGYINTPVLQDFNTRYNDGGLYLPPQQFSSPHPWIFTEAGAFDTSRNNIVAAFNTPDEYEEQLIKLHKGEIDSEQDLFIYNCEGISGKFVLDKNGSIVKIDDNDVLITIRYDSSYISSLLIKSIRDFTITGTNGIRYFFDKVETTTTHSIVSGSGTYTTQSSASAFQVSKAVDLNSLDTIYYDYTSRTVQYLGGWNQNAQYFLNVVDPTTNTEVTYGMDPYDPYKESDVFSFMLSSSATKSLYRIRLPDGNSVRFYYDAKRDDLYGDSILNRIEISDYLGNTKKFRLNYSYFNSANTVLNPTTQTWTTESSLEGYVFHSDHFYKRLKLDNIRQIPETGTDTLTIYSFVYNDTVLPPRNSKAIDFWGYYYGPTRPAVSILPQLPSYMDHDHISGEGLQTGIQAYWNYGVMAITEGADRKPDSLYARASTLKQINLPTGGSTSFKYQTNRVKDPIYADGWFKLFTTSSPNLPDSAAVNLYFENRNAQGVLFKIRLERVDENGDPYIPPALG